jgi:hypothetical protein
MEPVPIEVELLPPPRVTVTATVRAVVRHSHEGLIYEAPLVEKTGNIRAAEDPLRLPLRPPEGTYRLIILLDSNVRAVGSRVVYFEPVPIPFHELAPGEPAGVHEGVQLYVPLEYPQAIASGGPWAGQREWRLGRGVLSLWWAPGPTEELLLDGAAAMLEATHDPTSPPQVAAAEPMEWLGQQAFLFRERWPGVDGGAAEALVVQGSDFWLYVVRIRAVGSGPIPEILYRVRDSFAFAPQPQ